MSSTDNAIELSDNFYQDPYSLYRQLRSLGPIHYVMLPEGRHGWMITDFELARRVMADSTTFSKDLTAERGRFAMYSGGAGYTLDTGFFTDNMLFLDPPDHTRLRKLLTRAFTARAVTGMAPRIATLTEHLLDHLAGHLTAELIADFAFQLPVLVICELLGVPTADRDNFRRWSNTLIEENATPPHRLAAVEQMGAYLAELVGERAAAPQQDLLTELVTAREEDKITNAEVVRLAFLLLVAGHETTVGLIGNAALELLMDANLRARLVGDPNLTPIFLEEVLRTNGPVHFGTIRYAVAQTEIAGHTIEPGQLVFVSLAAAGRDPQRHADPDRFDIDRPDTQHIAFGHGVHYCIGAPLARMEADIAIRGLLNRFPHIALAEPALTLEWRRSIVARGLVDLPVTLRPTLH